LAHRQGAGTGSSWKEFVMKLKYSRRLSSHALLAKFVCPNGYDPRNILEIPVCTEYCIAPDDRSRGD